MQDDTEKSVKPLQALEHKLPETPSEPNVPKNAETSDIPVEENPEKKQKPARKKLRAECPTEVAEKEETPEMPEKENKEKTPVEKTPETAEKPEEKQEPKKTQQLQESVEPKQEPVKEPEKEPKKSKKTGDKTPDPKKQNEKPSRQKTRKSAEMAEIVEDNTKPQRKKKKPDPSLEEAAETGHGESEVKVKKSKKEPKKKKKIPGYEDHLQLETLPLKATLLLCVVPFSFFPRALQDAVLEKLRHLQKNYNERLEGYRVMGYWSRFAIGFCQWRKKTKKDKGKWKQARPA